MSESRQTVVKLSGKYQACSYHNIVRRYGKGVRKSYGEKQPIIQCSGQSQKANSRNYAKLCAGEKRTDNFNRDRLSGSYIYIYI